MDKIVQMLKLQQELNDTTNGIGWEEGITKNGKIIDWRRCIYLECAELIDSYPWKHWKNIDARADYDNIKIEAVDIWHFVMSEALREYKKSQLGKIEHLAKKISSLENFSLFSKKTIREHQDYYTEIKVVESLIGLLFSGASAIEITEAFLDVALISDLNLDSLYRLYIGKNILNQFRQDHGYKEGSYIKLWQGKEDNVIMQECLQHHPDTTPQQLYEALKRCYPKA